jgi:glycosyltransferase involved in cell wall biosynthesis
VNRIAFVSTMAGAPWGGSEELWSRAALRLFEEGHAISASVVWWPERPKQLGTLESHGINVSARKGHHQLSIARRAWNGMLRRIGEHRGEDKWLGEQHPDLVVISQGSNSDGIDWMEACGRRQVPYVAIVHCNDWHWWPDDLSGARLASAYRRALRTFCVSGHNLELLEDQLGERLANGEVVWNPCNVSTDVHPESIVESALTQIACVGRLEPAAKGQDILFQVLSMPLWRERPLSLNVYGSGTCERSLKRLADNLKMKNVFFHGQVDDISAVWRVNQLLALPSRFEGLPLSLVEAMWCGRPAVVTDVGGSAEVCVDGETGFVADAPTVKSFAEALERAWQSRSYWGQMGKAARRRIEEISPSDPIGEFCERLKKCVGKDHGD